MTVLRSSLLTDGPTDQVLIPILRWLLTQHLPDGVEIADIEWANLLVQDAPSRRPADRIPLAIMRSDCDLLFVHRDAEREPYVNRITEVREAYDSKKPIIIPVVPIRMTEAWLLHDEIALRTAAGNPNGSQNLHIPKLRHIENHPDPKDALHACLQAASGLQGRRADNFRRDIGRRIYRLADLIEDYSPLRSLQTFQALESELITALKTLNFIPSLEPPVVP